MNRSVVAVWFGSTGGSVIATSAFVCRSSAAKVPCLLDPGNHSQMGSDKGRKQLNLDAAGGERSGFLETPYPGHRRPRCCPTALQPRRTLCRRRRTGPLVAAVRNPIISVRYVVRNPAMPRAALAPAAPADPAARRSQPPATAKPRSSDLALAPRAACLRAWPAGARTRSSCPCRSPAIHGQLRCSMHGRRSTGPRTPAGRDRVRAARTVHGKCGAVPRALDRFRVTLLRISRVRHAAARYRHPAARARRPPAPVPPQELMPPPLPIARHHRGRGSRPAPRGCRLPRALARRHRRGARGPPRRRCGRTSHRRPDRIKCHRTKCPGAAAPPPRAPVARPRQPTVATARSTQSGRAIQTIPSLIL